ncbi:MAG: hypothetical protein LBR32_01960 [Propionibacteriaceae bacterium]|jgi:hypothetical protein|nr:hypothetical protein [Propionibacteriaceae bacterium]
MRGAIVTIPDPQAAQAIESAPLPTAKTLRQRRNPLLQLLRFAAINLKMMRVIAASH